jgi:hypothetical protein
MKRLIPVQQDEPTMLICKMFVSYLFLLKLNGSLNATDFEKEGFHAKF